ncbi:hypothetical protein TPHA_0E03140 [Tetrapisispora phaffii CBS 4417]|uniref:Complex III subunit 9 n=1 Tax=Tetrapisispora phaffii (strain ATCC 24235 / CBS 4417 / NBRC 1672 / NRRL Y-8282 / UCD 70-5) TaxID=1071381 RepID=G8BU26_TETPH|nr:hypothetical protein TPHA_0E03140 [Tetrapisispora phaffii CBS 4417]CCE63404.1 hypothetical protein TPHA_0E03140 [Tetrapisispora phaffii CBS 4417]
MSFSTLYKVFFKRNAVFVGTIFALGFVFQDSFDTGVTAWYNAHNKGKLWVDVKQNLNLVNNGDDADADVEDE